MVMVTEEEKREKQDSVRAYEESLTREWTRTDYQLNTLECEICHKMIGRIGSKDVKEFPRLYYNIVCWECYESLA